jgi:putative transposase
MRKTREFLLGDTDRTQCVHVVSRTAGQEILFGDAEKETFRRILFKQLKFSGLRALAWCFMGNHFHLLLEIPNKRHALEGLTEEDLIGRLNCLKGEFSTRMLLGDVEMYRRNGNTKGITEIAGKVAARLFDLSMFMKELKMKMTAAYNYANGRKGTLWEGRFKSVVVQGGDAVRTVAAYIDLNPIRAGLVDAPEDYRWCSYAAAVSGMRLARAGLVSAISYEKKISWSRAAESYRQLLFGTGQEVKGGKTLDGNVKSKGGFTQKEIAAVMQSGGKLSLAAVLRCRVRYFTDGVVLGTQQFVDEFFAKQREGFGSRRKNGGRRMKGAAWGALRTLRDLREDVIRPSSTT